MSVKLVKQEDFNQQIVQKLDKNGGEMRGTLSMIDKDINICTNNDRLIKFLNCVNETQGYIGKINSANNKYIVIMNKISDKSLRLGDDGSLKYGNDDVITTSGLNALMEKVDMSSDLQNGWQTYSNSYPFILHKTGNIVQISALIKGGVLINGTKIVTIPEKFRPKSTIQFPVFTANATPCLGRIIASGDMSTQNGTWPESSEYTICITYSID